MLPRVTFIVALLAAVGCSSKKEPVHKDKTLSQWREQLKAATPADRHAAADALNEMAEGGTKIDSAIPDLIAALADVDDYTRIKALEVLWAIGPDAKAAVPETIRLLKSDKNPEVRIYAAGTLGAISPDGQDAILALAEALRDADINVRCDVAKALSKLEKNAVPAIPALIEALKDPNDSVRSSAANALALMGKDAAPAIPALAALKLSKHRSDQAAAAYALGEIQKKD